MIRKSVVVLLAILAASAGFAFRETGYATHAEGNHAMELELVREFDPALGEFPKGIAFDRDGNIYFGMQMLGQVRKLSLDGSEETIATIPYAGPPGAGLGPNALAVVERKSREDTVIYAAFVDFDSGASTGIYRIYGDGTLSRVPGSEAIFGNGMTVDGHDNVYVTDSLTGSIWRIRHGSGLAELWIQHELLEGDGSLGFGVPLGAGDVTVDGRSLLVTVEEKSRVVRIDINKDGSAGNVAVVVEHPSLYMTEGIASAPNGTTYISSWFNSSLSLLDRQGNLEMIADSEDGLVGPVTLAFGTGRLGKYLYVVNQSGFIFPDPKPAIYRINVSR